MNGRRGGIRQHGVWLVLAAAVLGVFVFCGIVVAAAGNDTKPPRTEDVARNGALGVNGGSATTTAATTAPAADAQTASSSAPAPAPSPSATPAMTTATADTGAGAGTGTGAGGGAGAGGGGTTKATKPTTTKPAAPKTTAPPKPNCNPNYTPCVPNDPVDVDCAGGSGNGPSYVQGPVQVIGSDPYKLDTDHDGVGCE